MKAYILYRDDVPSEYNELPQFELIEVDSQQGQAVAKLYDVRVFPAVCVVQDDGRMVRLWQGELPEASEVSHWLMSAI